MVTRTSMFCASGFLAALLALTGCGGDEAAAGKSKPVPQDPKEIAKFQTPLVVPPVMPSEGTVDGFIRYEIAARQFEQQILPPGMPKTKVWGYSRASDPTTLHTPSFTIETRSAQAMRIKWINGLVDDKGRHLPHLLPVDRTLHWANPGLTPDMEGEQTSPYTGPVPIVTHVHGAHVASVSDGGPLAWYLPAANDVPEETSKHGSRYGSVEEAGDGVAVFEYHNDRRAETLWFHDHVLGMTRLNVYAGLAGFYLIRDAEEEALGLPGPAPVIGEAPNTRHYEIPIAIQDRSFLSDGSLAYPTSRKDFDEYEGPYKPTTPVSPVWNPEVFGNTIVVNGNTWPYLEVEPRLYRLRLLNGTNARTLHLKFDRDIAFNMIGNEGGFLSAVVVEKEILLGPAERADVIVDLSGLSEGDTLTLLNDAPDEPYQGPLADQDPADPETTGQILQLRVIAKTDQGVAGAIPTSLPTIQDLTTNLAPRDLTLNEIVYPDADIPVEAELGTAEKGALGWEAEPTETPHVGDTEIWRIFNLTQDAHPVHLHLVMFQVLDRTPFDADGYKQAQDKFLSGAGPAPKIEDFTKGPAAPAHPWENGLKDTVLANPGEITRIVANFDIAGFYVWHCHILEHEDNEMMRPLVVLENTQ